MNQVHSERKMLIQTALTIGVLFRRHRIRAFDDSGFNEDEFHDQRKLSSE